MRALSKTHFSVARSRMPNFKTLRNQLNHSLTALAYGLGVALRSTVHAAAEAWEWLEAQHPLLSSRVQSGMQWLHQRTKHLALACGVTLLAGAGGAYALANLGPDIAEQAVVTVTVPVEIAHLEDQARLLDGLDINLTRSDNTRAGESPEALLRRLGLVDVEAARFLRSNKLARQALLRGGRSVIAEANQQNNLTRLSIRWLQNDNDEVFQRFVLQRTAQGLMAEQDALPMSTSIRMSSGTVAHSLYDASDEAKLPDTVTSQLTEIFSSQIDFHRTLRKGAKFAVVYEVLEAEGEPLRAGRVLSAEFENDNKTFNAVWFETPGKKGAYYALDGKSLRRSFLAAPLRYTRITSSFGLRKHPILHTLRRHEGVDYAAPTGTPVATVGDGVVESAGWQNGYGNVVVVQHNASYTTVYGHLSRIQVKRGQSVSQGQLIGNVGSTGWSTGPHLHFEYRINGRYTDPSRVNQQTASVNLNATERARLKVEAERARIQLAAASMMRDDLAQ